MFKRVLRTTFRRAYATTSAAPKKRSSLPFYFATFVAGAATYKYVPFTTVLDYYLNSELPKPNDGPGTAKYINRLESKLAELPLVKSLARDPDWTLSRDWSYLEKNSNVSITEGALAQPGGFPIPPLVFSNQRTKETVVFVYVGSKLCGYPFIIHGGILATILDEVFKKTAVVGKKSYKEASTRNLELSYKFPTLANNFIVIKSTVDKDQSGNVELSGNIESMEGRLLVKGKGSVAVKLSGWLW